MVLILMVKEKNEWCAWTSKKRGRKEKKVGGNGIGRLKTIGPQWLKKERNRLHPFSIYSKRGVLMIMIKRG